MNDQTPLVSVIIPTYNSSATVIEAVDSALNQTHPRVEVVIVDDGSSDDTVALLNQRYGTDPRVKIFQQANAGPASARNHAVREATGDWIHFLDSDDRLHPTKITRSFERLAEVPGAVVAYGPANIINADGSPGLDWGFPHLPSGDIFCEWISGTMTNAKYAMTPSVMMPRHIFDEVDGFNEKMSHLEDWDLWIRLAARYPFAAVNERLLDYRERPDGLHRNRIGMANGRLNAIRNARHNPRAGDCLPQKGWDKLEAGRWHSLGLAYWDEGQPAQAREAFQRAQALAPSRVRSLYILMTYALPSKAATWVDSAIKRLRAK